MKELVIKIVGTAGQGVISSGDILSYAVARSGYYVTTYRAFPSEIRGDGKCSYQLRVTESKAMTVGEEVDIIVAFDKNSVGSHLKFLKKGGILIVDPAEIDDKFEEYPDIVKYFVPMSQIAQDQASIKSKNMVAVGFLTGFLTGIDIKNQIKKDIQKRYALKAQQIIDDNLKAFDAGFDYSQYVDRKDYLSNFVIKKTGAKLIMSGNEAIAIAAMTAGCRFFSGYPITPATEIMEFLAKEMPKIGGNMLQCEDEIAAVTAAIGASYGGVKAMTATSGPGLSLMSEAIGLSSMAEIPLVIVDVQRGGPSTGLPTKTEQSDLNQALFGTHGDAPKIVLAPINVQDCFYQTINAFNYAEAYQVPVILLSDANLGPRRECVDLVDFEHLNIIDRKKYDKERDGEPYLRYKNTVTGISPISSPGSKGGAYVATGLEHSECCNPTPDPETHKMMTEKRFRKLETATIEFAKAKQYGSKDAKVGIISWGSTTGPVIEAIDIAANKGYEVQALYPRTLYPLPTKWIKDFIKGKDIIFIIECNYTAQLKNTIIERCTSINKNIEVVKMLKYSGLPFSASEIAEKIDEVIKSKSLRYTVNCKKQDIEQEMKF